MVTKVQGAPLSGGLPAVPTGMSLADPNIQKQYSESIDKVLAALENRGDIPWFKISAAMADPGRTGSAAEGFGRAMGVLGQQQEENRARQLPVAQMRAQLVGQKYEMGKEAQALNAFATALGTTPQNIQSGISQAQNNPAMMQRLNATMPLLYGSPKITEMAKTMFGQYKDMANTLLEEFKAGMTQADLIAKYGPEIVPMIRGMGGIQPSGTVRPQAAPAGNGTEQNTSVTGAGRPAAPAATPASTGTVRTATESLGPIRVEGNRIIAPDGEVLAERGSTTLATWQDTIKTTRAEYDRRRAETIKFERTQLENADKERTGSFESRVKALGAIDPDTISATQGMYDSLDLIVNDPDMKKALGLMFKQGAGAAMYELAKAGVQINNFGIGVDAYPAFVKQLPAPKQEKLRDMERILATIFVQKAKDGKAAFGPQISNFDILLQKDQMASIRDTAKIINSWLSQERSLADHKLEIMGEYENFTTAAAGTNKRPYQFFTSQEYKAIAAKYKQIYRDLAITTYGAPN